MQTDGQMDRRTEGPTDRMLTILDNRNNLRCVIDFTQRIPIFSHISDLLVSFAYNQYRSGIFPLCPVTGLHVCLSVCPSCQNKHWIRINNC